MNYIPNKGASRKRILFQLDDTSSNKKFLSFPTIPENKNILVHAQPSQFVKSDGLPTKLGILSSISSPFVHRSNISTNWSSVSDRRNTNETPRDIISKYSHSFETGSNINNSVLDFSEIFKIDFNSNSFNLLFSSNPSVRNLDSPSNLYTACNKNITESKNSKSCTNKHFMTPSTTHDTTIRPTKSSTIQNKNSTNHTIVAITEGKGNTRGEVGIAAIDLKRPYLILCQISDSQTYVNTLRKINILNPVQIVVPNSFCDKANNKLYQLLLDHFPKLTFANVLRKYFNDVHGLQQVQNLCLPEYSSVELIVLRKSYALAATAAIIRYAEFDQSMMFSPKSVKIEYQSGDNITFIDLDTTQKLELVMSQSMANNMKEKTLYGTLNCCLTIGGQRRLRSLILQPSTDENEINERLNCVTELIECPELFISLKALLPKFFDTEQLLRLCTQIPNVKDSTKGAELLIKYALILKQTLEVIPTLLDTLKVSKNRFFRNFIEVLENPHYQLMTNKIGEVLNDDSHLSKSFVMSQFQRCFAIKPGIDGFLDIARLTYSELVEDFNEIVENLIKEYRLPLTIRTLKSKGSVLQMRLPSDRNFDLKDLPPIFIQVQKSRSLITMTTKELLFLKERMNHFIREIELLSSSIIFKMLQDIRVYVGSLYKLCEFIAELDVIVSFAQTSKSHLFVRPNFVKNRTHLKASLHPILGHIFFTKTVANDIFCSTDQNVCLITGPNMGGKSIYIRQVALLQIMAQIGCYVPAESAQFRLTDRIFARIGFNDSIECNASSFVLELKEMQYILNSLTSQSLIIIDELCRGTSTEEGTCIAWAICEKLLESKAFIFFTTHFLYLTKLQDLYCNVVNYHFEALEVNSDDGQLAQLIYTHRLVPGVLKLDHYGLKLARSTAMPEKVLQLSEQTAKKLSSYWKVASVAENSENEDKQIDNLIVTLLEELDNKTLTLSSVQSICEYVRNLNLSYLQHFSNEVMPDVTETVSINQVELIPFSELNVICTNEVLSDNKLIFPELKDAENSISSEANDRISKEMEINSSVEDEEMEFEHSDEENEEYYSQNTMLDLDENLNDNTDEESFLSDENYSNTTNDSVATGKKRFNEQVESHEGIAMGFVMSKKSETFDFQPNFNHFLRMNQTTYTIQSILKGRRNKIDSENSEYF